MHGEKPLVERDFRALHDGADRNRELLAAFVALIEAGTMRFAFENLPILALVRIAAMRANRALSSASAAPQGICGLSSAS